jgi:PKD repeat protein
LKPPYFFLILGILLIIGTVNAGIPPDANFVANDTSFCLGTPVQFTDTSDWYPTEWGWVFGDGNTSDEQNPVYIYTSAGVFDVSLNATNAFGSDVLERKAYIEVIDCVGNPGFSANVTCQIGKPLTVLFTGNCEYPTYKNHWDFGDGNDTDDVTSPEYTYNDYGVYTVNHLCMYAGSDPVYENKTDYIVVGVNGTVCAGNCTNATTTGGDDEYPNYLIVGATLGLICGTLIIRRNEQR